MSRAFMLRKLLACLALLTGLAAAGAPVHASAAVTLASSIEASAVSQTVSRGTSSKAVPAPARPAKSAKTISGKRASGGIFRWPTVYLGSDRARE